MPSSSISHRYRKITTPSKTKEEQNPDLVPSCDEWDRSEDDDDQFPSSSS